jgi:hypothetical protein
MSEMYSTVLKRKELYLREETMDYCTSRKGIFLGYYTDVELDSQSAVLK